MGDGAVVALRAASTRFALEPVRPALRVRRDDDLVRSEGAQCVVDRLERVAVADRAARFHPGGAHRRERGLEPLAGGGPRLVLVGHPVPERRVQRGRDDENLGLAPRA